MEKKYRILLISSASMCTIALLVVTAQFVINFWGSDKSADVANWGQTGDYFGGMLNPIVAVMNVLVTFYLAKELHNLTEKVTAKQTDEQRRILRRQLQFESLKDFNEKFMTEFNNVIFLSSKEVVPYRLGINKIRAVILSFDATFNNLFESDFKKQADGLLATVHNWQETANTSNDSFIGKTAGAHADLVDVLYREILG